MRARPLLCALLLLASCSGGGGGGGSVISAPLAQWGTFRHDGGNTALGTGTIDDNRGDIFSFDLGDDPDATYHAAPAIGNDGEVYIGTSTGLRALKVDGNPSAFVEQWHLQLCSLEPDGAPCDELSARCIEVGPINSTPAVTANDDLIVVAENGRAFFVHDDGGTFTCRPFLLASSVAPSTLSSAQTLIDGRDLSISSAFMGTSEGGVQAINRDGSIRWRFSPGPGAAAELTSSPAIGTNLYFVAPDGFLYAIDFSGRFRWRVSVGIAADAVALVPSPAVNVAVYAVTGQGGLVSYNPDGTFKWRFDPPSGRPILGSPAIVLQLIQDRDPNNPDDPTDTISVFEPIVYVVDDQGTLYGVRDRDGDLLLQDRCSNEDRGCTNDSDCPGGFCQRFCAGSDEVECLDDSDCPAQGVAGPCDGFPASVQLAPPEDTSPTQSVRSSPIITTDLFAIVGTEDGRLCARGIDNSRPGNVPSPTPGTGEATPTPTPGDPTPSPTPENPFRGTGCVRIADTAITSSPVMDRNGRVYVVAGGVLYAID